MTIECLTGRNSTTLQKRLKKNKDDKREAKDRTGIGLVRRADNDIEGSSRDLRPRDYCAWTSANVMDVGGNTRCGIIHAERASPATAGLRGSATVKATRFAKP